MTNNGRGTMRPQGRSPPFLVIGLLVALVILGANYWSLSSTNSGLAFEVSELQDQIRDLSMKRISAQKKIDLITESYNKHKEAIDKYENELRTMKGKISDGEKGLEMCNEEKTAVDNKVKKCEEDSKGIQDELSKVKEEINALKKAQAEEDLKSKCDSVCAETRSNILNTLERTSGLSVIKSLLKAGVDVGDYKAKVENLPEQPAEKSQGQAGENQAPAVPNQIPAGNVTINQENKVEGGQQSTLPPGQPQQQQQGQQSQTTASPGTATTSKPTEPNQGGGDKTDDAKAQEQGKAETNMTVSTTLIPQAITTSEAEEINEVVEDNQDEEDMEKQDGAGTENKVQMLKPTHSIKNSENKHASVEKFAKLKNLQADALPPKLNAKVEPKGFNGFFDSKTLQKLASMGTKQQTSSDKDFVKNRVPSLDGGNVVKNNPPADKRVEEEYSAYDDEENTLKFHNKNEKRKNADSLDVLRERLNRKQ